MGKEGEIYLRGRSESGREERGDPRVGDPGVRGKEDCADRESCGREWEEKEEDEGRKEWDMVSGGGGGRN